MNKDDTKFFTMAKDVSKCSDWKKQHIGAVITYKNKPLTIGYNSFRESFLQKKYNRYRGFDPNSNRNCVHAEMVALERLTKCKSFANLDVSKLHIYVYRELKDGTLALAKPCAACTAALKEAGIKHVHYTGNGSYVYEKFVSED